ncbi:neprosin family prolyl endopeptidase [Pyxidicoccus parkwayensis]|uniref:Neprosin family prolyl endopeptidase n=1 Tax=Pyxidicoccus parkwayensis TaxID=2813578 RepID=A0ABX7P221_9BACT|nr:neprosin family prolyl endopeptidase [Pyxidicoccus parkwaysis]QSQ24427.1 neprosin family prolyl endopeptidase [Pyxidicoccus parkwaysis]
MKNTKQSRRVEQRWLVRFGVMSCVGLGLAGCAGDEAEAAASAPETSTTSIGLVERVRDGKELARMQKHLESLYDAKDVVHHFRSRAGDDIDCVPLEKQPALRQPGMENHRIQLAPSTLPQDDAKSLAARAGGDRGTQSATLEANLSGPGDVDAAGNMRRCPEGTVPILQLKLETLKRFETLDEFRRKVPNHLAGRLPEDTGKPPSSSGIELPRNGPTAQHQYAHAYQGVDNLGAESIFNIWNPYTELTSEFSLSQMWVVRGSGASLETVEAGWQKYRDLYGNDNARLFIYFTPDNYGSGGCYNLSCGAFVQTNNTVTIGGAFSAYSVSGGTQQEMKLLWFKDGTAGNWWLKYGDTWVGYYPRTRFDTNGLADKAWSIDFGGEIIDNRPGGRHTATDMGSGAYPSAWFQYAAYQRNIQYVNTSNVYSDPSGLIASRDDAYCYDISLGNDPGNWNRYFFFGGPGYNANCM